MNRPRSCPVCQSKSLTTFLKREQVPIHQNLVTKDQYSAVGIPRGNLILGVCEECGFIFNQAFDASILLYGENYDNIQSFSCMFSDYLSHLVQHLINEKGVQNCHVVEVGCGKGLFLRKLAEMGGNICYGFDPSYVGPDTDLDGSLQFQKCYYGPEWAEIEADVVVSRHVIEHVHNPLDLLVTIRQSLANSPKAMVFFETPCAEWILRNQVIWDFFYEHCSYFSTGSLATAFETAGFRIDNIQRVFNGQYFWVEATASFEEPAVTKRPGVIPYLAKQFGKSEYEVKRKLSGELKSLKNKGKIALWGAGAKGVTLANLLDPDREWITCVVDLNPKKQGGYIPGTGHSIIGYQEMPRYHVKTAILMNPNYLQENLTLLKEGGLDIQLIDLMDLMEGKYEADH